MCRASSQVPRGSSSRRWLWARLPSILSRVLSLCRVSVCQPVNILAGGCCSPVRQLYRISIPLVKGLRKSFFSGFPHGSGGVLDFYVLNLLDYDVLKALDYCVLNLLDYAVLKACRAEDRKIAPLTPGASGRFSCRGLPCLITQERAGRRGSRGPLACAPGRVSRARARVWGRFLRRQGQRARRLRPAPGSGALSCRARQRLPALAAVRAGRAGVALPALVKVLRGAFCVRARLCVACVPKTRAVKGFSRSARLQNSGGARSACACPNGACVRVCCVRCER